MEFSISKNKTDITSEREWIIASSSLSLSINQNETFFTSHSLFTMIQSLKQRRLSVQSEPKHGI